MARILFDLQLSSYGSDGKLVLESDSNWQFTLGIIQGLESFGHQCGIIIPDEIRELPTGLSCNPLFAKMRYIITESDRYFMDPEISHLVFGFNPDIIWTNDPCRVGNYRSFWDGPLIAYNHWIDVPSNPKMPQRKTYFFRQMEAVFKADYLLFNSKTGLYQFENHISQPEVNWKRAGMDIVNPPLRTDIIKRVINRGYYSTELTIAFNHRLSSASQYEDNTQHLIEIMDELDKTDLSYRVLVSNPSNKDHAILHRKNILEIHSPDYEAYLTRLSYADIQLTLFDYPGQWSMSMAECLALGMKVIAPGKFGYKDLGQSWPNYYNTFNAKEITSRIFGWWSSYKKKNVEQSRYFLDKLSPQNVVKYQLEPIIKDLM